MKINSNLDIDSTPLITNSLLSFYAQVLDLCGFEYLYFKFLKIIIQKSKKKSIWISYPIKITTYGEFIVGHRTHNMV